MKRILALLFCLVMCLSLIPADQALATGDVRPDTPEDEDLIALIDERDEIIVSPMEEQPLRIMVQPGDAIVAYSDVAQFTCSAIGPEPLTYQWYYQKNNSIYWNKSTAYGCNGQTLLIEMKAGRDRQLYRCKVTDKYGNEAWSDIAMLIGDTPSPSLSIIEHPVKACAPIGELTTFCVEADGCGLSYQWQCLDPGGKTWYDSEEDGAKTPEVLVPVNEARNGQKYRCVVTDISGAKLVSNAAPLHIEGCVEILEHPESRSAPEDDIILLSVVAQGDGLSYQWQYTRYDWYSWFDSGLDGADSDTLAIPMTKARNSFKYRCVVTDNNGITDYSDVAMVTLDCGAKITKQPSDTAVYNKDTAKFTVEAEGEGLRYQWQYQKAGSEGWNKSSMKGAKKSELQVPATLARDGQKYRCKIIEPNGAYIYTEVVTMHVAKPPQN